MESVYCHSKDKTKRTGYDGAYAQDLFVSSIKKMGFNVYDTSLSDNKYSHKDYVIEQDGLKISTDVKYPKRISRHDLNPSSEWLWVEFSLLFTVYRLLCIEEDFRWRVEID